jgi:hypothetical protein
MNCSKCNFPNQKGSVYCSACGAKFEATQIVSGDKVNVPAGADVTINVTNKAQPKKLGCFGIVFLVVIFGAMLSLLTNAGNKDNQVTSTPTQTTGSYCGVLMRSLNESVEYMGNAGTKYTVADVADVLEKRGMSLASGFDVQMAGSAERLATIQDAGNQLLAIRVAIVDGGDISKAAKAFKTDFAKISASCN